jgi:hypothetical protein
VPVKIVAMRLVLQASAGTALVAADGVRSEIWALAYGAAAGGGMVDRR